MTPRPSVSPGLAEAVRWFVQYKCGCSNDAPRKKDLLEYCAKHGSNRLEIFKMTRGKK